MTNIIRMNGLLVILFISLVMPVKLWTQNKPDKIVGYYYYYEPKEKEYSQVEVYRSGDKYKGKVVWLKEPYKADGKPKSDVFNKDKSKHETQIIGISIFDGLIYNDKKDRWEGSIYDPANGDSFKCVIWFDSDKILNIKGFVGSEWMGLSRIITWEKELEKREIL